MIIVGEKINSSLKSIRAAIENSDSVFIQELAKKQYEAGATFIDVNAGTFLNDEPEKLEWLINTVQEVIDAPFSIDSPKAEAVERALKANKNGKPIINSITGEKERYEAIMPLAVQYKTGIIALCMDDEGMPETVDERVTIAERLIESLTKEGLQLDDIYIDPMVRPVGTGSHYGVVAIETIRKVKSEFPDVHIACGLSNISFGVPARKLMNQAFLVAAMSAGMDGAILDPLDNKLMSMMYATEALLGRDEFCMNYIMKFREGLFDL
ncbi:MAG: methyltetrahydrofolate cobalamin methyltransferase [Clostridia bacterium]|nr:methyltetrahydrofolate cobalamin methyltransferase [Clostridia bacterium]